MNAVEALKMVEGIPKEQFITGMDTDGINKCCFLGHYSRLTSDDPNNYDSENCDGGRLFCEIFAASELYFKNAPIHRSLKKYSAHAESIVDINDNDIFPPYTEPEIKDRLIHFLTDMVKAGY